MSSANALPRHATHTHQLTLSKKIAARQNGFERRELEGRTSVPIRAWELPRTIRLISTSSMSYARALFPTKTPATLENFQVPTGGYLISIPGQNCQGITGRWPAFPPLQSCNAICDISLGFGCFPRVSCLFFLKGFCPRSQHILIETQDIRTHPKHGVISQSAETTGSSAGGCNDTVAKRL